MSPDTTRGVDLAGAAAGRLPLDRRVRAGAARLVRHRPGRHDRGLLQSQGEGGRHVQGHLRSPPPWSGRGRPTPASASRCCWGRATPRRTTSATTGRSWPAPWGSCSCPVVEAADQDRRRGLQPRPLSWAGSTSPRTTRKAKATPRPGAGLPRARHAPPAHRWADRAPDRAVDRSTSPRPRRRAGSAPGVTALPGPRPGRAGHRVLRRGLRSRGHQGRVDRAAGSSDERPGERDIKTLWREVLDHLLSRHETHARQVLAACARHCSRHRPHQARPASGSRTASAPCSGALAPVTGPTAHRL